MSQKLYLHLTWPEWADTWVRGGRVPVKLASTYRSDRREGILTPDENLVHSSDVDLTKLPGIGLSNVKNFSMSGVTVNGRPLPSIVDASIYQEDGLILSFSKSRSRAVAERLQKTTCVQILNIQSLKESLDGQIGVKSILAPCRYTADHRRNHFLKSEADSWQKEHRLFWRFGCNCTVYIHPGTARLVSLSDAA